MVPRDEWDIDTIVPFPLSMGHTLAAHTSTSTSQVLPVPRHTQAKIPKINLKVRYHRVVSPVSAQESTYYPNVKKSREDNISFAKAN